MPKIPGVAYELVPEGKHEAVCIQFIDVGTQKVTFNGEEKDQKQCYVYWQIIGKKTKSGKNMVIRQRYTYSNSPNSNFVKMLGTWLDVQPKEASKFDVDTMLRKPAKLTVVHNGDYANVTLVVEGSSKVKPTEPVFSLHLTEADFNANVFNELSEKLQGTIADTKEYLACSSGRKKAKAAIPAKKAAHKK